MVRKLTLSILGTAALAIAGHAYAAPGMASNGVLVGDKGMTLYTFDKDAANTGKSVCNGDCATKWPPFAAPASAQADGAWTVVTRDDGSKQWAYQGKPVYYWFKDAKPGDKTGDGVVGVWHIIKP
ncbi:MAG TPA: hypothetical protein VGC69_00750 [Bordetella sp.]